MEWRGSFKKQVSLFIDLLAFAGNIGYSRRGPGAQRAIQCKKLNRMVRHAYRHIPYYRDLFDKAGVAPSAIREPGDLKKIPVTSCPILQALPRNKIALSSRFATTTSGSTGAPFEVSMNRRDRMARWLYRRRMYMENGLNITDRACIITTIRGRLKRKVFNDHYLSLRGGKDFFLQEILRVRPRILDGYPSVIRELAAALQEKGAGPQRVAAVFLTAEMLSGRDRSFIGSAFGAEVFGYYASKEFGIIGSECSEHNGYHIHTDNVIVEVVGEGEIVVTSLNAFTMPFIRYSLGDRGILGEAPCRCGRNTPLLRCVTGRVNDSLLLPGGRTISAYAVMNVMDAFPEVARYQVIQEAPARIDVIVKVNGSVSSRVVEKIKDRFQEICAHSLQVEVTASGRFMEDDTGKNRVVVSRVKLSE